MINPLTQSAPMLPLPCTSPAGVVAVGMSELKISQSAAEILTVVGLGSCVAVAAYCRPKGIGVLLHALLPRYRAGGVRTRFVDTGIETLVETLNHHGVRPETCTWWLSGGAQMLRVPGFQDSFQIGVQNVDVATGQLQQRGFKLAGQDVNGTQGRTVRLYMDRGVFTVRQTGSEERTLTV